MICPADGKPCCDDLCAGGSCLAMPGYEPLQRCDVCGGTIDTSIPECSTCTCDDDDDWYDDDDDWYYDEAKS